MYKHYSHSYATYIHRLSIHSQDNAHTPTDTVTPTPTIFFLFFLSHVQISKFNVKVEQPGPNLRCMPVGVGLKTRKICKYFHEADVNVTWAWCMGNRVVSQSETQQSKRQISLGHHAHLTHWRHSETQQSTHQFITKTWRAFNTLVSRVKHNNQNVKLSLRHHAHLTHWRPS